MAMASSGISDVPAAANLVTEARDGAARLRGFLLELDDPRAPWAQLEIDTVLTKLSIALDVIVSDAPPVAAAGPGAPAAGAGSDGAARPQQSASSSPEHNKRKQSSSSRRSRSQHPRDKRITATLDDDGHVWRKYGQKDIQDSPYPRSYYRCTHKTDQGCSAKRQVQRCDTDTSKYVVTYYGEHTCRDPSTIPLVDHAVVDHASNLISFGPSSSTDNAAAAASDGASPYLQAAATMGGIAAGDQLSTSWCTSDDVFSSSAGSLMQVDELIGAVVGSAAGAVTSAAVPPDRGVPGGMAPSRGGGAASFRPPSPNSLGFVVGSLGSIGGGEDDDDMFSMDP